MVAQGGRVDARLLWRGRFAWSPLLDIPPWSLQQRSSESPLVYAWGVRMNNQCAAPFSVGNEPIFADLAAPTNYSFLRGASHPSAMVGKARGLGYAGVGTADRNSVAGVVSVYVAVREAEEKGERNN